MNPQRSLKISGIAIDSSLLALSFLRACEVGSCHGACCGSGVWLSRKQVANIRDAEAEIAVHLQASSVKPDDWFEEIGELDAQFPAEEYLATQVLPDAAHVSGNRCVFWRSSDGHCALQKASISMGLGPWALKPLYCALYPLTLVASTEGQRLLHDNHNAVFSAGYQCVSKRQALEGQPIFQVFAAETALALGLDGYRALCAELNVSPIL